jgi:hypothetical protein
VHEATSQSKSRLLREAEGMVIKSRLNLRVLSFEDGDLNFLSGKLHVRGAWCLGSFDLPILTCSPPSFRARSRIDLKD